MSSAADRWLAQHSRAERQLTGTLDGYFTEQAARVVAALQDHGSITATAAAVGLAFRATDEHDALVAVVSDPIVRFMATGALTVWADANQKAKPKQRTTKAADFEGEPAAMTFGASTALEDFELPQAVKDSIARTFDELIGQSYWQDIQAGTETALTELIKTAIDEGLSGEALAKRLKEALGDVNKVRARAIARTETTLAFNAGHQATYEALADGGAAISKKWLAVLDGDTRSTHAGLNEAVVAVREKFSVGGTDAPYPGWWGLPAGERVNCRCTTVASI